MHPIYNTANIDQTPQKRDLHDQPLLLRIVLRVTV